MDSICEFCKIAPYGTNCLVCKTSKKVGSCEYCLHAQDGTFCLVCKQWRQKKEETKICERCMDESFPYFCFACSKWKTEIKETKETKEIRETNEKLETNEKTINMNTVNVAFFAREMVEKCKGLQHSALVNPILELFEYLQKKEEFMEYISILEKCLKKHGKVDTYFSFHTTPDKQSLIEDLERFISLLL